MLTNDVIKKMRKEDRKKQILDAAISVFAEKGFNGSTTLEISKAANISEVTLFRYFSSKQELFLEGIEPILFSTLEESLNISRELSAKAKLEYILYERISFISNNYKIVKLILTEASLLSKLGSECFVKRILQIIDNMLMEIGVSANDKEFMLRLIMGSILSFVYMPEKSEESIKNYVAKVVALILKEINK